MLFVRIIDFCEDLVLRLRSWSAPLLRRFGGQVQRMAVGSSAALSLFSAPSAVFLPSLRVLCVSAFAGRLRAHPPGSLRLAFSLRSNLRSKPKPQNVLSVALFQPDHLVAALPRQASAVHPFRSKPPVDTGLFTSRSKSERRALGTRLMGETLFRWRGGGPIGERPNSVPVRVW